MLFEYKNICEKYIHKYYNNSIRESIFPYSMKWANITPAHKKDDKTNKENYRPVSILPAVSNINV